MNMRSVQIQKVYDVAKKIEDQEEASYKKTGRNPHRSKFLRTVFAVMDDGSILMLRNSWVEKFTNEDGEWYIIFSEHYDTQVYHNDDILVITQYPEDIQIQKLRIK
jgi:hypothetical protein